LGARKIIRTQKLTVYSHGLFRVLPALVSISIPCVQGAGNTPQTKRAAPGSPRTKMLKARKKEKMNPTNAWLQAGILFLLIFPF